MRILINATGSHGDVLPLLALAREFQQRGHDARLYATAVFEPLAREVGIPFKALGSVEDYESLLRDPDISHPTRQLRVVARGMDDFGQATFQAMDADVLSKDIVIVGSTVAFVTRSLAEIHKIRAVTVHLAPSIMRTIHRLPRYSTWSPWQGAPRWLKFSRVFPFTTMRNRSHCHPTLKPSWQAESRRSYSRREPRMQEHMSSSPRPPKRAVEPASVAFCSRDMWSRFPLRYLRAWLGSTTLHSARCFRDR